MYFYAQFQSKTTFLINALLFSLFFSFRTENNLFLQRIIWFYHFFAWNNWITKTWAFLVIRFLLECSMRVSICWLCLICVLSWIFISYMKIRIMCICTITTKSTTSLSIIPTDFLAIFRLWMSIINLKQIVKQRKL